MKFINNGPDVQVRIREGTNRYRWDCVRTGETRDFPESVGLANGLKKVTDVTSESKQVLPKVTEGNIGKVKVETKQIEDFSKIKVPEFEKELTKINGIGAKTAWDITKVFPTEKKLREAISHDDELPFRDDIEKKLRDKYDS